MAIDGSFIALNEALNAEKELNDNNSAYGQGLMRASSDLNLGTSILNPIGIRQTSIPQSHLSTPKLQDNSIVLENRSTANSKTPEDIRF